MLLLAGYRPLLLFSHRDRLHLHDLLLERGAPRGRTTRATTRATRRWRAKTAGSGCDGSTMVISCATAFHNVQCQHGAVYVDIAGYVHIAELPACQPPLPSLAASASSTAVTLVSSDSTSYTHYRSTRSLFVFIHSPTTPRFLSYHRAHLGLRSLS